MDFLAWTGVLVTVVTLFINTFFNTTKDKSLRKKLTGPGIIIFIFGLVGIVATVLVQLKKSAKQIAEKETAVQEKKEDSIRYVYERMLDSTISSDLKSELRYSEELRIITKELNKELQLRLERQEENLSRQKVEILKSRFPLEENQFSVNIEFGFSSAEIKNRLKERESHGAFSIGCFNSNPGLVSNGDSIITEFILSYLRNLQFRIDIIKGRGDNFYSLVSESDIVLGCSEILTSGEHFTLQIAPTIGRDGVFVFIRNLPLEVYWNNYSFQVLQDLKDNRLGVAVSSDSIRPQRIDFVRSDKSLEAYIAKKTFPELVSGDKVTCIYSYMDLQHKSKTIITESDEGFFIDSTKNSGILFSDNYKFWLQDSLIIK